MKNIIYFILFTFIFPITTQALELTNQENEFIENNPKIKIALMPDFSPFSFIKDDRVIGFENDLLEMISQKTGIEFDKKFSIWNRNLKAFKEKKVDMITSISYKKDREAFTTFTTPYYKIPIMIFVRDDFGKYEGMQSLEGKKVGILKDIFYTKELKKYINNELNIYETYDELTDALVFGKIDALIQNLPNINYLIKKNLYTNLVLADELQLPGIKKEDLRFGINPDKPLLHAIIQKALDSIDEKRWEFLVDKWLSVKLIGSEFGKQKNALLTPLTKEEKTYLENNTVQIGMINDYYPFSYKENDKVNGFSYEYFKLLASKVDMKFNIQIENWSPTLDKFKNKKIDIIDVISYTKKREKFVNFSDAYFHIPNVIFTRKNTFKNYKGLESLKGKIVGITKNIYYFNTIKNLGLFKLVVFESSREKIKALALGKIDAAFNNLTSGQKYILQSGYTNIQVLDELDDAIVKKEELRLGVSKDNLILFSIVKKAMDAVTTNEKFKLINKYFGVGIQEKSNKEMLTLPKMVQLTQKEKSFLKSHPVIKVHNEKNWPPYNFNEKGKPVGYSIDIMNLIAKKTGLKVEYVTGPTWNEFLSMMKNKSLDVMLNIVKTPERLKYLLYTSSYANTPNVILSKTKQPYKNIKSLFGKTVAIPQGFFTEEILKKDYPKIKLLPLKNTLETMKAVVFGKADAALGEMAVFNYLMNEYMISGLSLSGEANIGNPNFSMLHIATRKDIPLLASILKKGVNSITIEEKKEYQKKWLGESKNLKVTLTQREKEFLKKHPKITLGTGSHWEPLSIESDGTIFGFEPDILNKINKATGANFTLKRGNWAEMQKLAKKRKIDGLATLTRTDEREKFLNFSTPYGTIRKIVIVKRGNPLNIQSLKDLEGKTIAIHKKNVTDENIVKQIKNTTIIQSETPLDMLKELIYGKADVAFGNISTQYLLSKEGLPYVTNAFEINKLLKIRFALRNDWSEAMSIFQKGLDTISQAEKMAMEQKWFGETENKGIILNIQENEYLDTKKEIKMCAIPNILPLEQIDENKAHKGIAEDIIQIVSQKINKPIVLIPTNSWSESLEKIKNKKCDILPAAMRTQTRQQYINFTAPYLTEALVVATKNDKFFIEDSSELKNRKIGIVKSYVFIELLKQKHPNIQIIHVKNAKDGLQQVQKGNLFGYVDILPSIAYTIQKEGLFDLKVAGKLEFDAEFSIASRKDEPLLNTILQKALQDIGEEEIRRIVGKWVSIKVEQSFDYKKLIYISLFFLVILTVVIYKNRSIKSLNKKLKELSITDNLTQLYNRNKIDEVLKSEANRSNRFESSFAVIMIDIDHFKSVNDIHGHQMGDTILKEFAEILQSNLRKTDTVGRWGGEEFILICSETDLKGATSLADNIREKIATYPFLLGEQKTASFGISMYKKDDDIKDLIKRADDALYKAKANGRNKVEVA